MRRNPSMSRASEKRAPYASLPKPHDAWSVVRMVVRQSAWLAGIGAALGAGLALAVAPIFAHQMEVIKPYDWLPYAATALLVAFIREVIC